MMEVICRETKRRQRLDSDSHSELCLGRRREWEIDDGRVSRCHCRVKVCDSTTVEVTNDSKEIYIRRRRAKRAVTKDPGSQTRVKCGDVVFLLRDGNAMLYGFELKKVDAPLTPVKTPKGQGMFTGMQFVFLTKSHIGPLRRRVIEEGADVVDEIFEGTDYVVVSEDDKGRFEELAKGSKTSFVKREFLSDCLRVGHIMNDRPYWAYPPDPTPKPSIGAASDVHLTELIEGQRDSTPRGLFRECGMMGLM